MPEDIGCDKFKALLSEINFEWYSLERDLVTDHAAKCSKCNELFFEAKAKSKKTETTRQVESYLNSLSAGDKKMMESLLNSLKNK